ncbi:MAG: porin family protein [Bacteroidales bacterium]|nr:porin family protein [Bacteroidales bacterium]
MRKKLLILVILSALVLNTYAWKVKTDSTFYAGAWGGASYAKIMGYPNTTPLMGSAFGVKFWLQPNREFSFSTGIGFIQKGYVAQVTYVNTNDVLIGELDTDFKFKYLNIPLGVNYNLGRNKFNIYLSAGIDIDILLKQSLYCPEVSSLLKDGEFVNINWENTEYYKKLNFGVYIGGGVEYRFKPNFIVFADVKYMHGINNIYNVDVDYHPKHRPLVFGLGIRIGIPVTYGYYD